jgi:hypothetical protein
MSVPLYLYIYIFLHTTTQQFDKPGCSSWHCGRRDVVKVKNGTFYDHNSPELESLPLFYTNFVHFWGGEGSKPWDVCAAWKNNPNFRPPRTRSGRACTGMSVIYRKYCVLQEHALAVIEWAYSGAHPDSRPEYAGVSLASPSWVSDQI